VITSGVSRSAGAVLASMMLVSAGVSAIALTRAESDPGNQLSCHGSFLWGSPSGRLRAGPVRFESQHHAVDSRELRARAEDLARLWDAEHVSPPLPPLLTHGEVVAHVTQLVERAPDLFSQEVIGQSVEGRTLHHVWFGRGPMHVLLWSQMHGDEPTATAALFDLHEHVRAHRTTPLVKGLLDRLTIHTVPMLNPDGAERYQRRNAQDIDINRDAFRLQTPEGRALKALRDRLNPALGFNLHNQNWGTSVGFPPKPATISLLAVSFNRERSDNPGRILAKKVSAVIRDAIEPMIPGQIGRYDDEFEVRAFGDNIAKWGTPVVLIETGPMQGDDPDRTLVRTNFVALVTALDAVASGRVHKADPKRYESLPFNESRLLHTVIANATLISGTGVPPFVADIGIAATRVVRRQGAEPGMEERTLGWSARIADLGDLQTSGALNAIDATGLSAAPLWDANVKAGDEASLPDWSGWKGATLAVGQPANVVLLAPLADGSAKGRYRVERVIRLTEPERK
jgi:Zinc carboxypeptidase